MKRFQLTKLTEQDLKSLAQSLPDIGLNHQDIILAIYQEKGWYGVDLYIEMVLNASRLQIKTSSQLSLSNLCKLPLLIKSVLDRLKTSFLNFLASFCI